MITPSWNCRIILLTPLPQLATWFMDAPLLMRIQKGVVSDNSILELQEHLATFCQPIFSPSSRTTLLKSFFEQKSNHCFCYFIILQTRYYVTYNQYIGAKIYLLPTKTAVALGPSYQCNGQVYYNGNGVEFGNCTLPLQFMKYGSQIASSKPLSKHLIL